MNHPALEDGDTLATELIAGNYEIIRPIARGSMGVVYEAQQISLNRRVALKILDPRTDLVHTEEPSSAGNSLGPSDRFLREAASAASLSHPNIAVIYDYGEWRSPDSGELVQFIAMELVDGQTLSEWVGRGASVPFQAAAEIIKQVLQGLAAAHGQSIVHRDLKLSNVLITPDGAVKLVDFGLAKRLDDVPEMETQVGLILGTPAYMAPELVLGRPASAQTDLYSVTCVLIRLLTGSPPYRGGTAVETMTMHISAKPPDFSGLDPAVRALILRGLSKDPEERFRSAEEYLEALIALDASPALPEPAFRRPAWWFVGIGLAALALVGGITLAEPWGPDGRTEVAESAPQAADAEPDSERTEPDEPPSVLQPAAATVTVTSAPVGASVLDGEQTLCTTPCELPWDGVRRVVLRASGYDDVSVELASSGTHAVTLSERRVSRSRRPSRARTTSPRSEPEPAREQAEPTPPVVERQRTTEPVERSFSLDVGEIRDPFE